MASSFLRANLSYIIQGKSVFLATISIQIALFGRIEMLEAP